MTEHPIKVLIVDDEPIACRRIARLLAEDSQIQVIGICNHGKQAVLTIQQQVPDLLFLDVQMPGMDGFSVLGALQSEYLPFVIFVTAYDQYAIQAFEVHALDYLLKPFDRKRFEMALQRAKNQIVQNRNSETNRRILTLLQNLQRKPNYLERLVVRANGRIFFVKTDEIDWIGAEGKYLMLHVGKDSYLIREGISALESRLDPSRFLRIHRSAIINIERVQELQSWFHGEYRVILQDGTQLMLSRTHRQKLQELTGKTL
jgi:two-component system LytT family response regulator